MKKIWILEDDLEMNELYNDFLSSHYQIIFFTTLDSFKEELIITEEKPSLAIIDLYLYDQNFLDNFNEIYLLKDLPFVVISGACDKGNLNTSFDIGAIDYIVKPFQADELQVKVARYIEKYNNKVSELEKVVQTLIEKDELTHKEIKIINLFLSSKDHSLKREEILKNIWKNVQVHPKTLDVHLYNLRKKIKVSGLSITCIDSTFNLEYSSQVLPQNLDHIP